MPQPIMPIDKRRRGKAPKTVVSLMCAEISCTFHRSCLTPRQPSAKQIITIRRSCQYDSAVWVHDIKVETSPKPQQIPANPSVLLRNGFFPRFRTPEPLEVGNPEPGSRLVSSPRSTAKIELQWRPHFYVAHPIRLGPSVVSPTRFMSITAAISRADTSIR